MTNNTLVNVSVMEASTNNEILKAISNNLTSVENSAFKVATRCAYLVGVAIPCGDGTITNKKALKPKEVYTKVNKSKATLSRWIKALKLVIDNNLFDDFNNGAYPFSFDKIIMIFENELTANNSFADLMKMSVVEIEALYKNDSETEEATEETEEATEETEEITEDNSPIVTFEYDGKKYSVHENALIKFLEMECTIA